MDGEYSFYTSSGIMYPVFNTSWKWGDTVYSKADHGYVVLGKSNYLVWLEDGARCVINITAIVRLCVHPAQDVWGMHEGDRGRSTVSRSFSRTAVDTSTPIVWWDCESLVISNSRIMMGRLPFNKLSMVYIEFPSKVDCKNLIVGRRNSYQNSQLKSIRREPSQITVLSCD